jgi:hypothetical protein
MNPIHNEIDFASATLRALHIRLKYNLTYCCNYQTFATPEQVVAINEALEAFHVALAKLESLHQKVG